MSKTANIALAAAAAAAIMYFLGKNKGAKDGTPVKDWFAGIFGKNDTPAQPLPPIYLIDEAGKKLVPNSEGSVWNTNPDYPGKNGPPVKPRPLPEITPAPFSKTNSGKKLLSTPAPLIERTLKAPLKAASVGLTIATGGNSKALVGAASKILNSNIYKAPASIIKNYIKNPIKTLRGINLLAKVR